MSPQTETLGRAPRVTLGDIADATGVSSATVDRVIDGRAGVQPHTREHVERIAARSPSRARGQA